MEPYQILRLTLDFISLFIQIDLIRLQTKYVCISKKLQYMFISTNVKEDQNESHWLISSSEHVVLKVSYCDRSMSVVRHVSCLLLLHPWVN